MIYHMRLCHMQDLDPRDNRITFYWNMNGSFILFMGYKRGKLYFPLYYLSSRQIVHMCLYNAIIKANMNRYKLNKTAAIFFLVQFFFLKHGIS